MCRRKRGRNRRRRRKRGRCEFSPGIRIAGKCSGWTCSTQVVLPGVGEKGWGRRNGKTSSEG